MLFRSTVLEVRDRGTGIPPTDIKHIFEPFYSGKNTNFNWGMGLYHVRTIVRSHLGSIRVENRPGAVFPFSSYCPGTPQGCRARREVRGHHDPNSCSGGL